MSEQTDLFDSVPKGRPGARTDAERKRDARRAKERAKGFAAPPGTGPAGETCGSCSHLYLRSYAKTYPKCALNRAKWTGGRASDVLIRSPACSKWEIKY